MVDAYGVGESRHPACGMVACQACQWSPCPACHAWHRGGRARPGASRGPV